MAAWGKWTAVVGGIVAVVGQFVATDANNHYWLPLVGGVLAVIGGFGSE
ncbi:MAG: hypothetical protein Q7S56_01835 [Nanoarchaeota archaeon]|nr:hypothetical protein [Nanoarchaeota archaeon]